MTDKNMNRTLTIALVTGIVTLLLGLCLGALVGGAGGYLYGRRTTAQRFVVPSNPRQLPQIPLPEVPRQLFPELQNSGGALVQEVVSGSPAEEAGMQAGDVITKVDNTPVDAVHNLADVLATYQPGDRVTLTVWRFGETLTIRARLGQAPGDAQRAYLGVRYVEIGMRGTTP